MSRPMWTNPMDLRWIAVAIGIVIAWSHSSKLLRGFSQLLSAVLDIWLRSKHQVKHTENGSQIPTVPYKFPNGQGDAEKFLNGRGNSLLWEQQYGKIYRIWSGMTPEIVLTRSEDVQIVFKDSDKHIKATNNNSGYIMSELLGKCVGLISGNQWKSVRSVCESSFLRTKAARQIAIAERQTEHHFKHLWEHSRLSESLIDPAQDLKMLPFWIIAETVYGPLTADTEEALAAIASQREKLFRYVIAGGITRFHWSKYLPTRANAELRDFKIRWSAFNIDAIHRAIAMGQSPPIVELHRGIATGRLTYDELLQTLDEMLFANLDVTIGGISWNLVFLAAYPAEQNRLRAEVSTQRRRCTETGCAGFTEYLLSNQTYLAACINESSRLRPLAAFTVPQAAPTARTVGGFHVPAGTNFIVDSYALNQRNPYWGKDATTYRPQRFLDKKGVSDRYNFWRYGFGSRQCMGKYVADVMIRVLLVHLVEGYELGLLDGARDEQWVKDPENWINHPMMRLRCTRRDSEQC